MKDRYSQLYISKNSAYFKRIGKGGNGASVKICLHNAARKANLILRTIFENATFIINI